MEKKFRLLDDSLGQSSKPARELDWENCVLCQEVKKELLTCPAKSRRKQESDGYTTMGKLLEEFNEIGLLPRCLDMDTFQSTGGIEETFRENQAKWHDSCRLRFNKTELSRAKRKMEAKPEENERKFLRSDKVVIDTDTSFCFFCDTPGKDLHSLSSFEVDQKVRKCATALQDMDLISKLSVGDMMALKARYHAKCLASLYNRVRDSEAAETHNDEEVQDCALQHLLQHINHERSVSNQSPVFKLSSLISLYNDKLEALGVSTQGRTHSTRLKNQLLAAIPDLEANKEGREIILAFKPDIGEAISRACNADENSDKAILAKAADIVRKDMLALSNDFAGSFPPNCQEDSVPSSLLSLVRMILWGSKIKEDEMKGVSDLTISQLIMFNSKKNQRNKTDTDKRHNLNRETPLPIYLGVMMHSKTRKKNIVDMLHDLGLSISYDRVLDISTDLGNKVCDYYRSINVVCPPALKKGVFTVSAVDNIDHNPSSTTSQTSFHGTGISLFQNNRTDVNSVDDPAQDSYLQVSGPHRTKLDNLPETYTEVQPFSLKKTYTIPINSDEALTLNPDLIHQASQMEFRWLEHVLQKRESEDLVTSMSNVTWSTFHAECSRQRLRKPATCSLLPLFYEVAHTEAMILHSMNVIQQAVHHLSPKQIPVIAMDQPLYALAKKIQWCVPNTHGEDKFVIMFGGLHIEMASLKVIGDLLSGSGWTSALVEAGIASSGTADSFLKASHVTKTRHAHQVTASSLYMLLKKAYTDCTPEENGDMSLEDWCCERNTKSAQFKYWYQVLLLEVDVLILIRSLRTSNFQLYVDALKNIAPWFFALDHTNYARWIPVHLRDMSALESLHPDVHKEFLDGNFTVSKSERPFSALAIDQAHEQNNACVKGDGGAVGLTENPVALKRWMLCGPEMARLVNEFENSLEKQMTVASKAHHEKTSKTQKSFMKEVIALSEVIEEMGNPFNDETNDLLILDSRDVIDNDIKDKMLNLPMLGQNQYDQYVQERLVTKSVNIDEPLKKNRVSIFKKSKASVRANAQQKFQYLQNDCSLFSRLYVSCQVRSGNLEEFFMHENQPFPPSLSVGGRIKSGTKSDLIDCLVIDEELAVSRPEVDVIVLDGAAIVHMLKPGASETFNDYANNVFLSYIASSLISCKRVDIVWDQYDPNSLKNEARENRGSGQRQRVQESTKLPKNWNDFLKQSENKEELFSFLGKKSITIETPGQVISTFGNSILSKEPKDDSCLAPCDHEEADTRIFLHVQDASKEGNRRVLVRTVDTDVVVLAVSLFNTLDIDKLWVAYGVGKHFKYIAAHEVAASLGPKIASCLPIFHALTGCDTVSFFHGKGKKSCWLAWKAYEEISDTFSKLLENKVSVEESMPVIERFVVLLYDRTSKETLVNDARRVMFAQKGRELARIPPTRAALEQHLKRAILQASFIWQKSLQRTIGVPSPSEWGWEKSNVDSLGWTPLWTCLPPASEACSELLKCGCKTGCARNCRCKKANLVCTSLCKCDGQCSSL